LVPEPGALPLGVLPRLDDDPLAGDSARQLAAHMAPQDVVPRSLPGGRIVGDAPQQGRHLVGPTGSEHRVDPGLDAAGERRAGVHEEVAQLVPGRPRGARVPAADPLAGEERHLHGTEELRALEVGALRVERRHPAAQLGSGHGVEGALQGATALRVEGRLGEERLGEGAQVEARAPDDERRAPRGVALGDPSLARIRPPRRRPALGRLGNVDAVVRGAPPLAAVGLAVPTSNAR
jgi:hypothetical protein